VRTIDGGGVRGLSQVEIMKSIMYRLNWDSESDVSGEGILPCERFDLMGGSGTGG
jgi:patatin-like phospholipase/acyl hydrolase